MTYEEALQKIKDNWASYPHSIKEGHDAVWIAKSDTAGSYEVDEEWIGVKENGDLVWAYASGCSCWDGDYSVAVDKTVKAFTLSHDWKPEDWESAFIRFAEKGEFQELK